MSTFFIRSGEILLVTDLVIWALQVGSAVLRLGNTPVAISAVYLVCLFGLPLIFIGGVLLSLGLMITFTPRQHSGTLILLSGLITLGGGLLASLLPQMLVAPGSGDTLLAWMAGLTILLTGMPMTALGGSVLFVGLIIAVRQHFASHAGK